MNETFSKPNPAKHVILEPGSVGQVLFCFVFLSVSSLLSDLCSINKVSLTTNYNSDTRKKRKISVKTGAFFQSMGKTTPPTTKSWFDATGAGKGIRKAQPLQVHS